MTRFLVVPQWQGSPSPRAMQLMDGAEAVAEDLPRSTTSRIDVPLEAGDALGSGVRRLSSLQQVRRGVDRALRDVAEHFVIVGGDCSVAIGGIAHAAESSGRLAVVWADAHPDLLTAETSSSHAFSGMALRAALGDGPEGLALAPGTISPSDVILVGTRAAEEAESAYIAAEGVRVVPASALAEPDALAAAVRATGADAVFVHVDVDVLDPAEMPGVKNAEPFGAHLGELVAALKHLRGQIPLAGASLGEFVPASREDAQQDLGTLLRLIGALA